MSIFCAVPGVYTLEFKSYQKRYKYSPGQFLHLSMDKEYDGVSQWPESRCFSIQNPQGGSTLKFTYSVKGAFTSAMEKNLAVGDRVWLKLPYGNLFSQPHNKENTVFIAGGTGITPFLSLFNDISFNDYIKPMIYLGFRSEKHNVYENELRLIGNNNAKIKTSYEEFDGQLDIHNIYSENGNNGTYFISGPPNMINGFRSFLISQGVAENNIISDDWD